MEKLTQRIEAAVRQWPHWSPAEQKRMSEIVEEVLHYCRDGAGNDFIRGWCLHNLRIVRTSGGHMSVHIRRDKLWGLLPQVDGPQEVA